MADQQLILIAGLLIILLILVHSLRARDRDQVSPIKLDDLLLGDDGKISKAAIVMLGSFALTSWVIFYLTVQGKLTDILFGAYLTAWVAPVVTRILKETPAKE